ncbi:MAG: hypothetical protein OER22_01075 [Gammaproteobacteria bacterium]|nr:hypothetical protein [Gammaproteobacteria bacterium]MDH3372504.1 hypothetical protein [Gammaproteobacteria bacterium]MDH3551184.1 hypothetical protein [Gammaproteobacteria bacterium]
MNQLNTTMRHRPARTVNYLPSSSYVETAGQLWDFSEDQEQGATVAPTVWYGTVNAGLRVRDKTPTLFIIDGTIGARLSSRGDDSATRQDKELMGILAQIRKLVVDGHVAEARSLFATLPDYANAEPAARSLARVLMLPKVEKSQTGTGHKISRKWMRQNSSNFKGRWVALMDDELLGDDKSCIALRKRIRGERKSLAGVQFLFVS